MMEHIIEIIVMLLGAAIIGFLIAWFWKNTKINELEQYITALEDKNNRLQIDLNKNDDKLIDCQTDKKKAEASLQKMEQLLVTCQEKLTISELNLAKKESGIKPKKVTQKKTVKKITKTKKTLKPDNLTKIEGIGPKLAGILKATGIESFKKLSSAKVDTISEILLKAGGNKYKRFDPTTWPKQAKLAAENKWDDLKKWQDEMKGGKEK